MSETPPPEHLVKSYDQELKKLRNMITDMGGIVENQVALSAEAIMHRDAASATRAVEEDPKVDALEREIETFAIRLLALRQPVASDLRNIVAALKITGDIERIGDYAANVAKRRSRCGSQLTRMRHEYDISGLLFEPMLLGRQTCGGTCAFVVVYLVCCWRPGAVREHQLKKI